MNAESTTSQPVAAAQSVGAEAASGRNQFPPTQWSMVLKAGTPGTDDSASLRALEQLCLRYWQPAYAFLRRQGRAHHEAEDAVQAFFARIIGSRMLQRAAPERGRFRTFLLTSLRNHAASEWRREHAQRRGGHLATLAIDFTAAGDDIDLVDSALTPEQAYDRAWAREQLRQAIEVLRSEHVAARREHVFQALRPLLAADSATGDPAARAAAAGMTAGTFHVAVHRARRRLGEILRELVAQTVSDPREVESELRHLIAALS